MGRWAYASGAVFEGLHASGARLRGRLVHGPFEYDGGFGAGGQREGQGVGVQKGLWEYRGAWDRDLRHGRGECRYADGSSYNGGWEEDERSGVGRLVGRDGSSYEGQWAHDRPHGQGASVCSLAACCGGAPTASPHPKPHLPETHAPSKT